MPTYTYTAWNGTYTPVAVAIEFEEEYKMSFDEWVKHGHISSGIEVESGMKRKPKTKAELRRSKALL